MLVGGCGVRWCVCVCVLAWEIEKDTDSVCVRERDRERKLGNRDKSFNMKGCVRKRT